MRAAEDRFVSDRAMPNPAAEVRVSGSHWALSDAAVTHGVIVETNRPPEAAAGEVARPPMNRTLRDVLPRAMSWEARRFFVEQKEVKFDPGVIQNQDSFYLYHVEAGTRVWELYCRLDAGDDGPDSLARSLADGGNPNYLGPWAMPTLGGAGGQTIVGAFSTGTHGGDVQQAAILDAVQAVHLIGTEGRQYWVERDLGPGAAGSWLVDPDRLNVAYEDIEVIRDPDVFRAAILAVGRLGIIYSVVLRVVRQYALQEQRRKEPWSAVRQWLGVPSHPTFQQSRFVQVVVNPMGQADDPSEHSCFTTLRTLRPLNEAGVPPRGRVERCEGGHGGHSVPLLSDAGGFFNAICASDSPARAAVTKLIGDLDDVQDAAVVAGGIAALLGDAVAVAAAAAAYAAAEGLIDALEQLRAALPEGPLGKTIAGIARWALDNDRMEVLRRVADTAVEDQHTLDAANPMTAISYAVMDIHNYLDVSCSVSGDSLEVFFDATAVDPDTGDNVVVAFVDKMLERIAELENGRMQDSSGVTITQKQAFPGYAALRFMAASDALLAMQQTPRVCAIEVAGLRAVGGTEPFLGRLALDAVEMGATVHWGQRNELDMTQVEERFGGFFHTDRLWRWRDALARLSSNGRYPTFSTAFTRRLGLEVVHPKVQIFTVKPRRGCAGRPTRISWYASDNPPGTTADLHVLSPSSSTPLAVIPLGVLEGPWDTLEGEKDVPMPEGRAELRLVVTRELNGRAISQGPIVEVQGFRNHDPLNYQFTAEQRLIGGAAHWCAEMSLEGSEYSEALKVEEIFCHFTGASAWQLRRAGVPNLTFSPAATVQTLDPPAKLGAHWLFFVTAAVGPEPPPTLQVQFKIIC